MYYRKEQVSEMLLKEWYISMPTKRLPLCFLRFLSSTNLDTVIAADTEVRNEIEGFARSQLERRGDTRSLEDKLKIAAESNHLVKAFQTSEGQRLMRKAELKSAQVY